MNTTKFTEYESLLVREFDKLNITPQVFNEVCKITTSYGEKYKELRKNKFSVFFVLMLSIAYNAGLKGGAVL